MKPIHIVAVVLAGCLLSRLPGVHWLDWLNGLALGYVAGMVLTRRGGDSESAPGAD